MVSFCDFFPQHHKPPLSVPSPNNDLALQRKVIPTEHGYAAIGTFRCLLDIEEHMNELDQIECHIEHLGQQFKRQLCQTTLETADERCTRLLKKTQPQLHKHGKKTSQS